MKKQTKKLRSVKVQPTKQVVVHSRRQRILGIVALTLLFLCGFFVGMSVNEKRIVKTNSVQPEVAYTNPEESFKAKPTCEQIELLLIDELSPSMDTYVGNHIGNAAIYANLSERGCPENRQKYVDLARQELEIARALKDDKFYDNYETVDVVETYKRLHMQAAAEEIFEKAKKLTNPAIDFILQVEKIINE